MPKERRAEPSLGTWVTTALRDDRIDPGVESLIGDDTNDWLISRPLASLLTRLIVERHRRSVLEFGAGLSSVVLATALDRTGGGRLTSVEHEPRFCQQRWGAVKALPSVDAQLVVSRLALRVSRHGLTYGYPDADAQLAARGPFDLVLIDAPPGRFGRDGVLYDAYVHLADGAIVVLDDAARASERTAVRRWLTTFPGLELAAFSPGYGRGTAVLVHSGDKHRRWAWRAVAGTVHDRVSDLVGR